MHAKTEELLNLLLWSADRMMRPTFRNLTDSYESWAYRNGLSRQIRRLEDRGFLERGANRPDARVYRLTELGRLRALGGRDPVTQWSRAWDGRWRLVVFDVPVKHNVRREMLRRFLRERGLGCLQDSVWITPDSMENELRFLKREHVNVQVLIVLEARPYAGESHREIVAGAWNFSRINAKYARHLGVLKRFPDARLKSEADATKLRRWAQAERQAWMEAMREDPLLPDVLQPSGYMGQRAWRQRMNVLRKAHRRIRAFSISDK